MRGIWTAIDEHLEEVACVVLLTVVVGLVGLQVVLRFLFQTSLAWADEITRFAFVWFNYMGVALGAKRMGHIRVTSFIDWLPGAVKNRVLMLADVIWIMFNLAVCAVSVNYLAQTIRYAERSPILDINTAYVYSLIPASFALTSLRIVQVHLRRLRSRQGVSQA